MKQADITLRSEDDLLKEYFDLEETNLVTKNITEMIKRNLDIKRYDRMISDTVASIKNGDVLLNPDYQRNYLWDNTKASKLIESVLLNIPIPVIYAAEEKTGKWNIVDGLQRLNSFYRYYNDDFKLINLEVLPELNGKKYSELAEDIRRKLDRGDLSIILLLDSSDLDIQYDIFIRLNSGAVHLNEQELRNCLYRGTLNDKVKNEFINDTNFVNIFNLDVLHKRMVDVEIVLRYLAFSEYYDRNAGSVKEYDGRVKNIINRFMRQYQNADNDQLNLFKDKFSSNIEKCWFIFGEKAFKKVNANGTYDTRINRPLYETIMISFEEYKLDDLMAFREQIVDMTQNLIKDNKDFNDYISTATGNTTRTESRIRIYMEMLKEIFDGKLS